MKHSFALAILTLALSACTSAPKLTSQELEAQRVSTLKVYADNRVGMKTARDWLWTSKTDSILAVEVDNHVYNAKDVESITREQKELIVVKLTSGEELKMLPNRFRWVSCNTSKACPVRIEKYNGKVDLNGTLKSIQLAQLKDPDTIKLGRSNITDDPRSAFIDDSRASPNFSAVGDRVVVLKDAEFTNLNERIATVLKDWDDKAPERKARKARELGEIKDAAKRRFDQLRSASIGSPAYCEREVQGELPKDLSLNCPNHGGRYFSIEDFDRAGWSVVSINTTPIVDSLGHPFTMYHVSFKKVR